MKSRSVLRVPGGLEGHNVKTTSYATKNQAMNKKPHSHQPRLVKVSDKHGDELTPQRMAPPRLAQELIDGDRAELRATTVREDLQAIRRRPLDAPMATRLDADDAAWENKSSYRLDDVVEPIGVGRLVLTLLLMASSFIAGVVVGRWA